MLKKTVLCIFLTVTSSAYAQKCVYLWELNSLGVSIGSSEDEVYVSHNKIYINSIFSPSNFLRKFNVQNINRSINYDGNLNFLNKKELYLKNKKEFNIESNKEIILAEGKSFDKKFPLTVDSTSFPYVKNIANQIGQELPNQANILTKNKVIYGEIQQHVDHLLTSGKTGVF